jgi:formylglycine-generating enzyme required for sulfatase activity
MPHIFISYAKKDTRKLATDLADALNAVPGYSAWVDRSLRAGAAWELEIQREIRRCDVFVVLYSPDINRHLDGEDESYVLTEISYAKFTARKSIIPIMVQRTDPPMSLTMIHYIDFTINGLTVGDLVDAICSEVGQPITTTGITSTPAAARRASSAELLPAPFAWIEIPGGRVTLISEQGWEDNYIPKGQSRGFDVPAFAIAKYPLTNAQYALFVKAGGYVERKWWTDEGWQVKAKGWNLKNGESVETNRPWTKPRFWRGATGNGTEQPVVGVSWYEAIAYCRWLSDATGDNILLPTEQQWQRAAQGDNGRTYPWGSEWDCGRCNNSVERVSKGTTLVTYYEGMGDSPFGVVDMAGNVLEWCLTAYNDGKVGIYGMDNRVLRGGAYQHSETQDFRCTYRFGDSPHLGYDDWGFRLARSK